MNVLDISLVAETLVSNNISAMKNIYSLEIENSEIEVLTLLDVTITQKETSNGNNIIIVRSCFEYPELMIKSELDEFGSKAANKLEGFLSELLESENKVFSLKSVVTKLV